MTAAREYADRREPAARQRYAETHIAKPSQAHPPCYYCGVPVAKVVCWPPVCRACDDLPGWEAL